MSFTIEQAVRVTEIARRKADELFVELINELQGEASDAAEVRSDDLGGTDPATPPEGETTWTLGDAKLDGAWEEAGHEKGVTYHWPDGNVDEYADFVKYRGKGDYVGFRLALGYKSDGDVIGFVLGAGSKRGLTYFFPTDDFEKSREKISMIRGGGPRGRSGFAPGEALPNGYAGFKTDVLRDRKAGKWNVQGVVADENDYRSMLGHTALQALLRGLV